MNPFLRYLADKNSAHTQTDRHTPLTTIPDGLRRAGNNIYVSHQRVAFTRPPTLANLPFIIRSADYGVPNGTKLEMTLCRHN